MNKMELYQSVLENVCLNMEVDADSVKSSNKEECVDARYLVIALLSTKLSDRQIVEVSGWSQQLVSKVKGNFDKRCKFRYGLKDLYKNLCIFAGESSPKG